MPHKFFFSPRQLPTPPQAKPYLRNVGKDIKSMKTSNIVLAVIMSICMISLTQETAAQNENFTYAYIAINGKIFSKKLKVTVDFGDTPEQISEGEKYSELLTNKKSYAAVLNYRVKNQFELIETLDYNFTYNGTGGTSGIVFIMRKKK